jgi:drug/metabolite transporter (DMT)-like permease
MGILLGLTAALCWGAADFLARYATRKTGSHRALLYMQFVGLLGLSIYMGVVGGFGRFPANVGWQPWAWSALLVIINVVSSLALYRAFEIGILTVVSPVSASYAALTVVLAVLSGETLSQQRGIGIAATLIGVTLAATSFAPAVENKKTAPISQARQRLTRGAGYAFSSSIGYGIAFWVLGFHVVPAFGGIAPVWLIRVSMPVLLMLAALPLRQSIRLPHGPVWWYIAGAGLLDTVAFVAAAVGLASREIAVVSVLASLFSTVTVMLAWFFLRENLSWNQWVGIAAIFVGITLVSF